MNMIKELESILKQPNFMGHSDNVGVNLAVNAILDKIEDLGFELVQKDENKINLEINPPKFKTNQIVKYEYMKTSKIMDVVVTRVTLIGDIEERNFKYRYDFKHETIEDLSWSKVDESSLVRYNK